MGIESLARPEIVAMKPYSSARKEAPGKGVLLNANESPRPLLDEAGCLNRYPDPQPADLVARLAALYGVPENSLLLTRGSDEGIDLLVRVFCRAGQDAILHCPPTFGMYRIAAQTQGAAIVSVNRQVDNSFKLLEGDVLQAVQADARIKLVFLTSPNNPTGDLVGKAFLERLLEISRERAIIVLDEAYAEFCAQPSAAGMIAEYENLVVLRTMSKAWASAGLRCGAVLAGQPLISLLQRVIAPYPVPSPVMSLAMRMLEDDMMDRQRELMQEIENNKRYLLRILQNRSFIRETIPGGANFVLIRVDNAPDLLAFSTSRGVIIRGYASDPLLHDCLRISVGSEIELAKFAEVLDEWETLR
jgi:histidinol-phosphate aminotransferase